MPLSLDRRDRGWRLVILTSLGVCAILAVCATVLFLQGMSEAQAAFRRFVGFPNRGRRIEQDPRGFQPYIEIALLVASSAVAAVGMWRLWRWQIRWAVAPLGLAAVGFGLGALGMMWSSTILHPCIDDGAFYNCQNVAAGDRIALATLLLAVAAGLCCLAAVRTGYLAVWDRP